MNPVRNIKQNLNKKLEPCQQISNGVNLISRRTIKNLLQRYQIRPSKRLGQNFLVDEGVIKRVIEAAQLSQNDIVLEIGPGIGNLTMELAKRVKKVIAIEKDQKMVEILKELLECANVRNVEIVKADILKIDPKPYTLKPYKVVANLPFYITAPVIRKFLEAVEVKHRASACGDEGKDEDKVLIAPQQMVLVVQKEVAQRICAKAPDMSILAVSVQFYAEPEIIFYISKKSFWPQPKVDSAIIKIIPRQPAPYRNEVSGAGFRERFFRIVKAGFSQPRKQILNNFSEMLKLNKPRSERKSLLRGKDEARFWLLKNNINPTQRAETLTIEDWINLTKSYKIKK